MEMSAVIERVEAIASVRAHPCAGADLIESGLVAVREVQAWCDAQHAALVSQLQSVESFPEHRIAKASKKSLSSAAKTTERSKTLTKTPRLADALDDGAITADHIDAVTRAAKKLDTTKRAELIARADALADVAKAGTVDEFSRRLDLETKRLQDDDGLDRLARQRRNVRARTWVDPDGMWNLSAKFDPVTGVRIAARIDAMVQAMFGQSVPDECPDDPIEKQRYLTAHAVAKMLLDEALTHTNSADDDTTGDNVGDDTPAPPVRPKPGRPEFVVVIDADATGHTGPVAEFSIPVEIPARVLATLAGDADIHTVVVRNGSRAARTRRVEPGAHHPTRQPRAAPSTPRPLPRLCHPRVHRRLRPLQTPPHHLVAQRRPHRPRQSPAGLQPPPHEDPPRRMGHRARPQPRTHPATPRRQRPHHRATQPTNRRLTHPGSGTRATEAQPHALAVAGRLPARVVLERASAPVRPRATRPLRGDAGRAHDRAHRRRRRAREQHRAAGGRWQPRP